MTPLPASILRESGTDTHGQCRELTPLQKAQLEQVPFESREEAVELADQIEDATGHKYSFVVEIRGKHYRIYPSSVQEFSAKPVKTHDEYWDCECDFEQGYIWPKDIEECPRCGARAEDQPDSRIDEIKNLNQ